MGDIMQLKLKTALAALTLSLCTGTALADDDRNDRDRGISRVAGVFVTSSTAEFITTGDGQTFECEFLVDFVPGLVCGQDGIVDIRPDGTIGVGTRWKKSGRREISTFSVDPIKDADNVVTEWQVFESVATFDRGFDTFTSTFVQKRYPVTTDISSPMAVPNSTTTGTITGYRFEPNGF